MEIKMNKIQLRDCLIKQADRAKIRLAVMRRYPGIPSKSAEAFCDGFFAKASQFHQTGSFGAAGDNQAAASNLKYIPLVGGALAGLKQPTEGRSRGATASGGLVGGSLGGTAGGLAGAHLGGRIAGLVAREGHVGKAGLIASLLAAAGGAVGGTAVGTNAAHYLQTVDQPAVGYPGARLPGGQRGGIVLPAISVARNEQQ